MNRHHILLSLFLLLVLAAVPGTSARAIVTQKVSSPDGRVTVSIGTRGGRPVYTLQVGGRTVIRPSALGYALSEGDLSGGFALAAATRRSEDYTWGEVWGEEDSVRCHYNELSVTFRQRRGLRRQLQVVVRVFDDGIGFRYVIPRQIGLDSIHVTDELTEIALAHDAEAWSIPSNHAAYMEGIYRCGPVSRKDTVCTPLTIEYEPGLFMAIHEAALVDYASLNLTPCGTTLLAALTPWSDGTKVRASKTLTSPWRTIIFAPTAGGLVTNRVMLNLNEPTQYKDLSWIEPGRYLGIWWGIHKKKMTWEQGPRHGATTANVKRYIDFAARHGFQGILSEGWNPGWGRGEQVTFLSTYPDFDLNEVCRYAREKSVRWIGHTETWGSTRLLEQQMDSVFARFHSLGVNAVKTGYVGQLFDGRELNRSQYGIRHYLRVVRAAARHHIMIDNHEPAMPTGLQRTYPNLMTQEGVRGQEYNAWDPQGGNPPSHTATLPFTRGLAGPTDFTPAIFDFSEVVKGTHPHSTLAKQLAEFVVIYSPLQMAADEIESYEGQPAFTFIESCPTTWSRTVVPAGEIGRYVAIARRERDGGRWFMGCLTDEESRGLDIPLRFLDAGVRYRAVIYEDGPGADYERQPMAMTIRQETVTAADTLRLELARSGGAAIRFEPLP